MLDVKFTLDWKFEGPAAAFLLAKQRGYFEEEGLDVTIDSGNGSAGAVTRVASGAYDIAMADLNSMIEFNAENPDKGDDGDVHHLQRAAVRDLHAGIQRHRDRQGHGGQDPRRAGVRRPAQAVPGVRAGRWRSTAPR
ncbi:MAG: ABC transporter substrate-binding protein [Rhodovibrio sp.]|nr:ABC transporter substrate-binding protein [Rhodovibrio sp.]